MPSSVLLIPVWAPETVTSWLDCTTFGVPAAPVVVLGDGCGNDAGAGLPDEFWGRFFGVAPRFSAFLPRPLCKGEERRIN